MNCEIGDRGCNREISDWFNGCGWLLFFFFGVGSVVSALDAYLETLVFVHLGSSAVSCAVICKYILNIYNNHFRMKHTITFVIFADEIRFPILGLILT